MSEPPASKTSERLLKLAAVVGLQRFVAEQRRPEFLTLGRAMHSLAAEARRGIKDGDERTCADLEAAANLVVLILREGMADEQVAQLEHNDRLLLRALVQAAGEQKPTTGGAIQT